MIASRESWKIKPFAQGSAIPYAVEFSSEEYQKLRAGLVPQQMEDKWFVYFEEPYLFFHRSWTGFPVYRLTLAGKNGCAIVTEALCSSSREDLRDPEYQAQLLDFLVSNLLLGKAREFPVPPGLREPAPGVFQHHVAGTGYRQKHDRPRKPWWAFWR
jgi:hypothetical protein